MRRDVWQTKMPLKREGRVLSWIRPGMLPLPRKIGALGGSTENHSRPSGFAMQNSARDAMSQSPRTRDPYLVKSVLHASRLLSAFRSSGEALPLREVAGRSGLPKSMAFRLLYTLERCGMVEKVGANLYRSSLRPFRQKLYRLGYAAQGTDYQFSKEVSTSVQRAAAAEGIE